MSNMMSGMRECMATADAFTGREHKKELLAVMYDGHVYLTRHRPDSDWFKNCIADGAITVTIDGKTIPGTAECIEDEETIRRVCTIKYPNDARAKERRVAIRVRLDVQ